MKGYLLYNDEKQTKLIAIAYSVKERKEISAQYETGQWFSYDLLDNGHRFDVDTEKKVKCKFGTAVKKETTENKDPHKIKSFEITR